MKWFHIERKRDVMYFMATEVMNIQTRVKDF
jgi:hypothetical protein